MHFRFLCPMSALLLTAVAATAQEELFAPGDFADHVAKAVDQLLGDGILRRCGHTQNRLW